MNNTAKYIERRERNDNHYERLRRQSVDMLQRLSGERWTDYNAHDPGVTMLDLLNNALEELRYKLDFPLPDYLVDRSTGRIPFDRMGLLPFDDLLRDSIVTPHDYEKLMVDNLPGVAACRAEFRRGYYDFTIYPCGAVDREELVHRAARLYHANRNLCETLGTISFGEARESEKDEHTHHTPTPRYTHRDIAAYHSVQHDFPDCYGINRLGVPAGASMDDRARILQLKAYLLIFDHLLAGAAGQAAQVGGRLLLSGTISPDRWPEVEIDGSEQLIDRQRRSGGPGAAADFALRQRKAWFDVLDMLYGESTEGYFHNDLEKRADMIRRLPELNRRRFCAFDIMDNDSLPEVCRWAGTVGSGGFHIIEHLLLYPRGEAPEGERRRVSLLRPWWMGSGDDDEWQLLCERLPAHIALEAKMLSCYEWHCFEMLYFDWRGALAASDTGRIYETADRLLHLIER